MDEESAPPSKSVMGVPPVLGFAFVDHATGGWLSPLLRGARLATDLAIPHRDLREASAEFQGPHLPSPLQGGRKRTGG
jgi:hypothetical protein